MEPNDSVAAVAAEGAAVAPETAVAKKTASRKKSAPQGSKAAKAAKSRKAKKVAKAKPETKSPRSGSKTAVILDLIGRAKGATLADITAATGWQAHSVRGFLSTAGKKHSVKIESEKKEGGVRVYRILNQRQPQLCSQSRRRNCSPTAVVDVWVAPP